MKHIPMNKKIAKSLGLLSAKEAKEANPESGDLLYEPQTGLIYTGAEFIKEKYITGYFRLVKPTDRTFARYHELIRTRDSVRFAEKELKMAKEKYDKQATALQSKNTTGIVTRFVVFHHRKNGHVMEPESIELKNDSVLLDFGRRFDGLWISIIETPHLVHPNEYREQFSTNDKTDTSWYRPSEYDLAQKLDSTGYRSGEKFLDGCDEVKVMGGIRQAVPLPTPEQKIEREKERKRKIIEAEKEAERNLEPAKNDGTRTTVFAHRGIIGIMCPPKAEGVSVRPGKNTGFGTVVDADFVDISSTALKLLRSISRGRDSLGEIDIFKSDNGRVFGWIGGAMRLINPRSIDASRDYDTSFLKAKKNVAIPDDFKKSVDEILNKK